MAENYLYINCSKYFSLNPANGNLKSLCPPSVVKQGIYNRLLLNIL